MKLHKDKTAFVNIIEKIHKQTNKREDVLEKDYYVTLVLQELANQQCDEFKAFFKGGTALYKGLKTTHRFSEDIDISVDTTEKSKSQDQKLLEKATKKYNSLERIKGAGFSKSGSIMSVYSYTPSVKTNSNDPLGRFGELKIEATSFTISQPTETIQIAPLIYELSSEEQKNFLTTEYDIKPFSIQAMTQERIFIDKLFAAETYVRKTDKQNDRSLEAGKHIYDLYVMKDIERIKNFIEDEKELKNLLDIRKKEEHKRLGGIHTVKPNEFIFFQEAYKNNIIEEGYNKMLNIYVFDEKDRYPFKEVMEGIQDLHNKLNNNKSWSDYRFNEPKLENTGMSL